LTLIPRSRGSTLWRFALAAALIIAFAATTTAVAGLLQFKQAASYLSITPALPRAQVTIANPGDPQSLLLIGSDHRAGTSWHSANTDTMLLVRLDPNSATINVLSLPRDLRVQIPGHGTWRLNEAYSMGGPNLLLRTIKANVFPQLGVSHILDVNFGGFRALVNAIGCVYADVDHRYYNNTAVSNYASIDIQPGYQKLCGTDALAFVRFRHTDNDIVRNARQQDFLRWAKDQYTEANLIADEGSLLKIFGRHVQTDRDLHTTDGLINLFNLVAFSAGHQIKQISFPAIIPPCGPSAPGLNGIAQQTPCYVTANPAALQATYRAFMAPTVTAPPTAGRAPGAAASAAASARLGPVPGLVSDLQAGRAQAGKLGHIKMPVYVPRLIRAGARYCTPENTNCTVELGQTTAEAGVPGGYPRPYVIHDQSGTPHTAYRLTLVMDPVLGEYFGVQGTTWQNPPILGHPTETKNVGNKQLLVYANGGRISLVAWRTPDGVYWVSNTLNDAIGNRQMVAIAASLTRP
jgi:LCP family protein required for cell wall assembly